MKQVLQSLKTGIVEVAEVPVPQLPRGSLLIQTSKTLVSSGTERMLLEFGKAGLLGKARQQPDKIKMVLDKIRTDGLQPTLDTVFNKLDYPLALGYCNVGRLVSSGEDVVGYERGQRVVSNGKHAELVSVPANLCVAVPDNVSDDAAVFTVLGAIGLQGIRLARPTLGETVVVIGLGLVGLMTVQLLRAQGCRVVGVDFATDRLALAQQFGAEVVDLSAGQDPVAFAVAFSRGRGVDAVLITADTKSDEPIHQAAQMCRKRGRIVLVGTTGLRLSRADFYEKELSFQVSCSYGPGRYDPDYEEKGFDYPMGFVRWTEQRNFEAVLDMMADGRLNVLPLISHTFSIENAERAYSLLGGHESSLAILLNYPGVDITNAAKTVTFSRSPVAQLPEGYVAAKNRPKVSFIGSGNYATSVLIPAFRAAGADFGTVVTSGGVSGLYAGRKFRFAETTSDSDRPFSDATTDAVVIATRHNSHAGFVIQALDTGKHIFVEKPLCLTLEELAAIEGTYSSEIVLMVGFNRRFAPHIVKIKSLLKAAPGPKALVMTVNAGAIPPNHWTQDFEVGGGRIVGECCHFIDLMRHLVGHPITRWNRTSMAVATQDTVTLNLLFADGSTGAIHYFSNGPKSLSKERLEVFASGGVLQLDNYRKLTGFGWPGFEKLHLWRQNKGQKECAAAFLQALRSGGPAPIPPEEIFEVSRISIELAKL